MYDNAKHKTMADNMDNGRDADKTEYETASDINGADISTDAPVNEASEQSAKLDRKSVV